MEKKLRNLLAKVYSEENLDYQLFRYNSLIGKFKENFEEDYQYLFSSPGRTEICGNHTDHNNGKVVAASINLDSIAAVSPNNENIVKVFSDNYNDPFIVDLKNLNPIENEKITTAALIRGVASGLVQKGFKVSGFNAAISSDVLIGSGLSSSASIEVLIGTIFNHLFNEGKISFEEIAIVGQYAENYFFGKPCGLMDQVACAAGLIVFIDFKNPKVPLIEKINFDFDETGYKLLVLDTEDNHADLTEEYAAIPNEMKQIAEYFNKKFLREINSDELLSEAKKIRKALGDRAVLRALHFLEENARVDLICKSLKENNFNFFLELINKSGDSSFKYLQNIYSPSNVKEQGVALALALTDIFINKIKKGACRVHGGGFAGTIQVFLPKENVQDYIEFISKVFKKESVKILSIRKLGAVCLNQL